jgi:hypothetical protein
MSTSPTDLDRLHDLALPPEISWWPLAPGWIVLFVLAALLSGWALYRSWKTWRSNAYRREALAVLSSTKDAADVAELLRRTALAIAPRDIVAPLSGHAWLDWLSARSPVALSASIRAQLTNGVYAKASTPSDLTSLRDFAAQWIRTHRI